MIIDIALSAGATPEAVWIRASLAAALVQKALRDPDKQVPETSICSVHNLFKQPTIEEGFNSVRITDVANPPSAEAVLTVV